MIEADAPRAEKSALFKASWAAIMLFSGTFTTLTAKIQFEQESDGVDSCNKSDDDDTHCPFEKPWFSVLEMKLAMALCLPLYYGLGWGREPGVPDPEWTAIRGVWLPASLDLLNTVLGNIGLVWVNSSIYQMTRGSVVIFSALLSVKWLGRTLRQFHYWSILFVLVAVVLVGFAGTQEAAPDDDECADDDGSGGDESASAGQVILGLGFILAAQLVTAIQFIVEERFMCDKATMMSPIALVGFEGLWGLVYFCFLAPILSFTPRSDLPISTVWHENFYDSAVQLKNSSSLILCVVGYMVAILAYNVSANFVTQCLSAVVRSILEACRTVGVWVVGILIFYIGGTCGDKVIGEAWTSWSFLELGGFAILLAGTFSYKGLIKIPWVSELEYAKAEEDEAALRDSSPEMGLNDKDIYNLLEGSGTD